MERCGETDRVEATQDRWVEPARFFAQCGRDIGEGDRVKYGPDLSLRFLIDWRQAVG